MKLGRNLAPLDRGTLDAFVQLVDQFIDGPVTIRVCDITADFKISMGHAAAGNLPEHGRMSCGRTVKYHDHHAKQTAFFFFVYS